MSYFTDYIDSPQGAIKVVADNQAILEIKFCTKPDTPPNPNGISAQALTQLQQYIEGKRRSFDLPLGATGTDFQQQVWQALCNIPYGSTVSYADIARQLNNPKAVRAVGAANGRNPIAIVVPCHRVIGANGTLTGYAGGLERKAWLLNLERGVK